MAVDEEQQLLYQLQEITRVMQEGQFVDTVPANTDNSCGREWDGETRRSVHIVLGYHLHILAVFIHDRCVT